TVFLAAVLATRVFGPAYDVPIVSTGTLVGATVAVALALLSVWSGRRVGRVFAFAYAQVMLDVVLVAGAIAAVWSGVPGSAALLFFLPIANAAGLLLWRGACVTALAASAAYFTLLSQAWVADPDGTWLATVGLPAAGGAGMFLVAGLMVGVLARR